MPWIFVGLLCDEIQSKECIDASRAADSAQLAEALRALIPAPEATAVSESKTAFSGRKDRIGNAGAGFRSARPGGDSRSGALGGLSAMPGWRIPALGRLHSDTGMFFSGRRSLLHRSPDSGPYMGPDTAARFFPRAR